MDKVFLNALRHREQLDAVDGQKVISAVFADEECKQFCIMFECDDGKKRDVSIFFEEGKWPKIYVSEAY